MSAFRLLFRRFILKNVPLFDQKFRFRCEECLLQSSLQEPQSHAPMGDHPFPVWDDQPRLIFERCMVPRTFSANSAAYLQQNLTALQCLGHGGLDLVQRISRPDWHGHLAGRDHLRRCADRMRDLPGKRGIA